MLRAGKSGVLHALVCYGGHCFDVCATQHKGPWHVQSTLKEIADSQGSMIAVLHKGQVPIITKSMVSGAERVCLSHTGLWCCADRSVTRCLHQV